VIRKEEDGESCSQKVEVLDWQMRSVPTSLPDRVIHRYISQQSPKTITHFVKDVEAIPSRTHN
jgi:hypothetical protein